MSSVARKGGQPLGLRLETDQDTGIIALPRGNAPLVLQAVGREPGEAGRQGAAVRCHGFPFPGASKGPRITMRAAAAWASQRCHLAVVGTAG